MNFFLYNSVYELSKLQMVFIRVYNLINNSSATDKSDDMVVNRKILLSTTIYLLGY